jgi:hypothetical protein
MCEPKRRWQQENSTWVQLGLKSYLRFYEITQGSARDKSYEDFVVSPYYNAFVKFGSYCQQIRCINFSNYLDWLLKNNRKLDNWCSDRLYGEWLPVYLQREAWEDGVQRSILEMEDYANNNLDLKNGLADYFRYGSPNRICYHISTGRTSAWVVYNCASGIAFLDGLNTEQVGIVLPWIDPDYWQKRFQDCADDTETVKHILKTAGL